MIMKAFKKYSVVAIMLVMIGACDKYNLPIIPKPKAEMLTLPRLLLSEAR